MTDIKPMLPQKKNYLSETAQYNYTNMFASPFNPEYYKGVKKR